MRYKDIQDLTIHRESKEKREKYQTMSYYQYKEKLFEMHCNEPKVNMFGATFII